MMLNTSQITLVETQTIDVYILRNSHVWLVKAILCIIYILFLFVAQPAFLSILVMYPSSINFCGSYASQNWVMGKKTVGIQFFEDQQHALRVDVPSKPNP